MHIKFFKDLNFRDAKIAGGKGASLGEMTRAGIPVPPGFVVLASAFEDFIAENDLNVEINAQLKKVNIKKISTVEKVSKFLRSIIIRQKISKETEKQILSAFDKLKAKYVAVRSSATAEDSKVAAWAGQLETYLGIEKKEVLAMVKNCWSSLFTPRAIFYRLEKNCMIKKISVAVVVQKMIESDVAGVAFTAHPVTRDKNQMVLEGSWGLGESVVSGRVTPDTYIIDKKKMVVLDININQQTTEIARIGKITKERKVPKSKAGKQCLNNRQIIELAKICQKIENHYGFPCDVEWALAKGKFYITQSRPITTL